MKECPKLYVNAGDDIVIDKAAMKVLAPDFDMTIDKHGRYIVGDFEDQFVALYMTGMGGQAWGVFIYQHIMSPFVVFQKTFRNERDFEDITAWFNECVDEVTRNWGTRS